MPVYRTGPGASSASHTLRKATRGSPASDRRTNRYACRQWTLCLYKDPEGNECLEQIDCGTVPEHFRNKHGIPEKGREVELVCAWQSCGRRVTRHNYNRHIRECHLKHDRVVGHANQPVIRLGG
ncbi:hypothetical protein PISMIDRAFT_678310 [Pisolithus microcarpus 441]|uniref:Uncharacterized protein n=1 Tax=Pisolithus microcarpus 441 TaxID=765257 RepID=A0A0C9ZXQ4_9AGAM|nr:hypothetical protein PISMIDRAFT_678310 [Pisolithus microcarpus 441]